MARLNSLDYDLQIRSEENEISRMEQQVDSSQLQAAKQEFLIKRAQLEQKKKSDLNARESEMALRLEQKLYRELHHLSTNNAEFIDQAKKRIADLKHQEYKFKQEQLQAEEAYQRQLRMNQVEKLVRAKLELEKIQKQKNKILKVELKE